jgi:hypothetical protein
LAGGNEENSFTTAKCSERTKTKVRLVDKKLRSNKFKCSLMAELLTHKGGKKTELEELNLTGNSPVKQEKLQKICSGASDYCSRTIESLKTKYE